MAWYTRQFEAISDAEIAIKDSLSTLQRHLLSESRFLADLRTLIFKMKSAINTGAITVHNLSGIGTRAIAAMRNGLISVVGGVYYANGDVEFADLVSQIGSSYATIYVTTSNQITSNLNTPANIYTVVLKGGGFAISTGMALTFANPFGLTAGRFHVFTGLGTVAGLRYVEPEWFGALGDGSTDDAPSIVKAYNALRALGGMIDFQCRTYIISFGFWVPKETTTFLNGCRLKATTTYAQGAIPTGGTSRGLLWIGASLVSSELMTEDYANISIIGDGAILDGNVLNQTGTVPGYSGFQIETTPSPIVENFLRVKNILVKDLTITHNAFYGGRVNGAQNARFQNVRFLYSGTNGCSVIGGKDVTFDGCEASRTRGPNATDPAFGAGFWHEPNETWQSMENIVHLNCKAEYNYGPGFRLWNSGQDAGAEVYAIRCKSRFNSWDTVTDAYRSSVDSAGFHVAITSDYVQKYLIVATDCTAEDEYQSGFKVQRVRGGQTNATVQINNFKALNCFRRNTGENYERAHISVVNTNPYDPITQTALYDAFNAVLATFPTMTRVEINSPYIEAHSTNTLGYGIGVQYLQDVFVKEPAWKGPFTFQATYASIPPDLYNASGYPNAVIDVGSDNGDGIIGDVSRFFQPVRLPYFDQVLEPAELLTNQIVIWKVEDSVFVGIWNYYDASIGVPGVRQRYVPMMDDFGAPNQLLKSNPNGNGWGHSAVTIDENNIMDGVERINVNGAADQVSTPINTVGNISAAQGSINSFGVGAPGGANTERATVIHDGATADFRSLAGGTGTVRALRLVADTSIFSIDPTTDIAGLADADLSITSLGKGLKVKAGTNGRINLGNVLVAGTVTVANTSVTANTMISWNRVVSGGTLGEITITRNAGVGYTITSSSATETSTIDVMLTEAT